MAGIIRPVSTHDPLREAMPDGLRRIVDTIFPPNDTSGVMGIGTPMAVPASVVMDAPQGLIGALKPMTSGVIDKGKQLASELMGRFRPMNPVESTLENQLSTFTPEPTNLVREALNDRVTGARPPVKAPIKAPEGFRFPQTNQYGSSAALYPQRDPKIAAVSKVWDKLAETKPMPADTFHAPRSADLIAQGQRPPLSGKWTVRSGPRVQKKILDEGLKKKP